MRNTSQTKRFWSEEPETPKSESGFWSEPVSQKTKHTPKIVKPGKGETTISQWFVALDPNRPIHDNIVNSSGKCVLKKDNFQSTQELDDYLGLSDGVSNLQQNHLNKPLAPAAGTVPTAYPHPAQQSYQHNPQSHPTPYWTTFYPNNDYHGRCGPQLYPPTYYPTHHFNYYSNDSYHTLQPSSYESEPEYQEDCSSQWVTYTYDVPSYV